MKRAVALPSAASATHTLRRPLKGAAAPPVNASNQIRPRRERPDSTLKAGALVSTTWALICHPEAGLGRLAGAVQHKAPPACCPPPPPRSPLRRKLLF